MLPRPRIAGLLAVISAIIPWTCTLYWYSGSFSSFSIDWLPFSYGWGVSLSSNGAVLGWAPFFSSLLQWPLLIDKIAPVLSLILVVSSGALILLKPYVRPRIFTILLLIGAFIYVLDSLYDDAVYPSLYSYPSRTYFIPIPVGLGLIFVACVLSMIGSNEDGKGSMTAADKLLKLKSLLDSGAITDEEFQEQKEIILEND